MRLSSAYDDFLERTVHIIPNTLGRVRFLSSIRHADEDYQHWGLERTFGKEAAQIAMRRAHTEAFLAELSIPISQLWEELVTAARDQQISVKEYVEDLTAFSVPADQGGGSEQHHSYIVKSLVLLAQRRGPTNRQAA